MPTWTPMCKCMQVYCEPFFVAVSRWRTCGSEEIMRNRLALCETAFEIMNEYSQAQQNMEFDVACEEEAELEPEVMPSAGKDYIFGGDRVAYESARKLIPEDLFNRVGIFFQQNLLKGMAGNGDSYLATCNDFNRKSIIAAIEKLFRIPTKAGKAHFVKRVVDDKSSAKFKIHATVKISTNGQTFGDILLDSVKQERVQASTKKEKERSATVGKKRKESAGTGAGGPSSTTASSASKAKKPRTNKDDDEDDARNGTWTTGHHSVGTQVANYFSLPGGRKLFRGEVVKYSPPSRPRARDQLYHICWEDGDEEDYDESQLQTAVGLFARHFAAASSPAAPSSSSSPPTSRRSLTRAPRTPRTPTVEVAAMDVDESEWSTTHASVGTQVAAVFKVKRKPVIYRGQVMRYCPPTSSTENDQLYHVRWEDSDSEDYDEDELQAGIALFEKEFGAQADAGASSSSSSAAAAAAAAAVITISSDSSVASPGTSGGPSAVHVDYDTSEWTTEHAAVGSPVALFFPPSGRHKKLFRGIVTKFAPETAPNARDQLYHVDFEDGDACDLEEDGFHQGIALYQLHCNGNNVSSIVLTSSVVSADEESAAGTAVAAQPAAGEAAAALEAVVNAISEAQASSVLDDCPADVAAANVSTTEAVAEPSQVSAELPSESITTEVEEAAKAASSSDAEVPATASEAPETEGAAEGA